VRRRHPDVHDHEIRLEFVHAVDKLVRSTRLADYLEPGSLEQAREPFAQEDVVVRHDDAARDRRLPSHDLLNLTPLPGSGYEKIPALRL
jgi:hypothetical protein